MTFGHNYVGIRSKPLIGRVVVDSATFPVGGNDFQEKQNLP